MCASFMGQGDQHRVWGLIKLLTLLLQAIRQSLTALEADLEPGRSVERSQILQHSHIQHGHFGCHLTWRS